MNSYPFYFSDFGMSRIIGEKEYYKSNDTTIPVKWCSLEVLKYGKFSIHSGNLIIPILFFEECT